MQSQSDRREFRASDMCDPRPIDAPNRGPICATASAKSDHVERARTTPWANVVATREAFRLCERERRHLRLEAMLPDGSWDAVIADAFSIDDILEAREALAILGRLPDRQRADLTLLVAGFSYVEIAELTGGRTYTNVNKHIAKARARVRLARLSENADRGRICDTGAKNRARGSS
jgi:DNA-directed RNA polymerase specialized sigma24 family protein